MSWPPSCVRPCEPLADHTSFRIGGPAEWFAQPDTLDELVSVLEEAARRALPVSVVGGGTNTLAADRGTRGLVLHLGRGFRSVEELAETTTSIARVSCGASALTQRLVFLEAIDIHEVAGTPVLLEGEAVDQHFADKRPAHFADLRDLLAQRASGLRLAAERVAVGIQPGPVALGLELSACARSGLEGAAELVVGRLAAWGHLCQPLSSLHA